MKHVNTTELNNVTVSTSKMCTVTYRSTRILCATERQRKREKEIMRISCNKTTATSPSLHNFRIPPPEAPITFLSFQHILPHYFLQLRHTILRYTKRNELFVWKSLRGIFFRKLYSRGHWNRKREWECLCPPRRKLFRPPKSLDLSITPIIATEFLVLFANVTLHFLPLFASASSCDYVNPAINNLIRLYY